MTAKQYYKKFEANDILSPLWAKISELIIDYKPNHVLEFGCGTGKNLAELHKLGIPTIGIDISFLNCIKAISKYELPCIIKGDEDHLRHLCNCDIVFTISVLDHIPEIEKIIPVFKRIANKAIFLVETQDVVAEYYYAHNYLDFGFEQLDFSWQSDGDGATYKIWKFQK